MRKLVAVLAGLAGMASAPAAAFDLDMSPAEFRKAAGIIILADLAVGETGIVYYPTLCAGSDSKMLIYTGLKLAKERTDYGLNWLVTRQPGGVFRAEVIRGTKSKSVAEAKEDVLETIGNATLRDCTELAYSPLALLPLESIDGVGSMTGILQWNPD